MKSSEEGRQILLEKPRVTNETWNLEVLLKQPSNTFGH
jgi:ubiquinone biosynthesis protein Coq4